VPSRFNCRINIATADQRRGQVSVGSSITSKTGLAISACAMASICCSPPLNSLPRMTALLSLKQREDFSMSQPEADREPDSVVAMIASAL
jgi:hypothetical protein